MLYMYIHKYYIYMHTINVQCYRYVVCTWAIYIYSKIQLMEKNNKVSLFLKKTNNPTHLNKIKETGNDSGEVSGKV